MLIYIQNFLSNRRRINYTVISQESILINSMGTLLAAYTVVVVYIAVKSEYKRPAPAPAPAPAPTEKTPIKSAA